MRDCEPCTMLLHGGLYGGLYGRQSEVLSLGIGAAARLRHLPLPGSLTLFYCTVSLYGGLYGGLCGQLRGLLCSAIGAAASRAPRGAACLRCHRLSGGFYYPLWRTAPT
jgi:hypothetical protein